MHRTPTLAVMLGFGLGVMAADPKDPKSLDVSAEATAKAKVLIAKLDDDNILVRDKTTDELRTMGRRALPALTEASKGKLPKRVLDRVLEVLPAARQADFTARYPLLLADKDRKYEHDLPGWNELKAAVKDTKESRALMADLLGDEECRGMLILAFDMSEEGQKQFEGRWKAKKDAWWVEFRARRQPEGHRPKAVDTLHWPVAALLADLVAGREYRSDSRVPVLCAYFTAADEGKLAVAGKGKYGAGVRDLACQWIERQNGWCGMQDGEWLAREMKFDEAFVRGCTEKQFETAFTCHVPSSALGTLAYTRDAKYIASFRRLFDWEDTYRGGQFAAQVGEIQVRDAALSMCIALSGHDPVEYGYSAQNPRATAKDDARYWTDNYYFKSEDGKSADDKRKAAFAKWAEWEKANPEKIKAKAPEKK